MADLTITHTHADGTLLEGDPRPHHAALKTLGVGWRWSRNLGCWYIRGSRDRDAHRGQIGETVKAMQAVGFTVDVEIDDAWRPAAERYADQRDRAAERAGRMADRADRAANESDNRYAAARGILDVIPMGQPVLVGHHSERRHRRDLERADTNMRKSVEASRKAEHYEHRAAVAERTAQGKTVGQTRRKIDELDAEIRRCDRELGHDEDRHKSYCPNASYATLRGVKLCKSCGDPVRPLTDDQRAHWERVRARTVDEADYWRGHLAQLEADGAKVWGPGDFKPGDRVNDRATVVRVNRKSLTVRYDAFAHASFTNRLGYDAVKTHQPT